MKKELYYNKRIFLSIFIVLISCLLLFNGSVGAYELTARSWEWVLHIQLLLMI